MKKTRQRYVEYPNGRLMWAMAALTLIAISIGSSCPAVAMERETLQMKWLSHPQGDILLIFIIIGLVALVILVMLQHQRIQLKSTELKLAHDELIRRKNQLENIINGTSDAVFIKDLKGRYQVVNREVERVFGRLATEIIGRDDTWFMPESEAQTLMANDRDIMEGGPTITKEEIVSTVDGTRVYLATKGPVTDDDGTITGLFGISRDITGRVHEIAEIERTGKVNRALAGLFRPLTDPEMTISSFSRDVLEQALLLTESLHGYVSEIDPISCDNIGHTLTEMILNGCSVEQTHQRIVFSRNPNGSYSGLWGHALNTCMPFYTNSPYHHPAASGIPSDHVPLSRFLSVPVLLGTTLVGQISLANSSRDYSEEDLDAIARLAEFYALAIQRIRVQSESDRYENLLADVGSMVRVGGWELDIQTMELNWTEEVYAIHELPLEYKPKVETAIDFYVPDARPVIGAAIKQAIEHGTNFDLILGMITAKGRPIKVHAIGKRILKDGNRLSIRGTFQDVTEKWQADNDLAIEKRFTEHALDCLHDLFYTFDLKGRMLRWNKELCRVTGYNNEQIAAMHPIEFFLDSDRERVTAAIEDAVRKGSSVIEALLVCRNGSTIAYEFNGSLLVDQQGQPEGVCGVGRDISVRRRQDDSLRKLSRAVEQSPVSIVITDLNGRIEFVNPMFTKITGYSAEDAIGQNPRILKSNSISSENYQKLWSTITAGGIWEGELLNRSRDGRLFWEKATISPLRDADGLITHYIAVKEDITESRLLMEQLLQSQKIESLGQLAGGLAHDYNNILSVINGYACLMKMTLDDPGQIENAESILNASERAAELTHNLLAYSRKQVMQQKPVNVTNMLDNFIQFVRRLVGENIQFQVVLPEQPLFAMIDQTQMEQVLINLVTNARDAMTEGGWLTIAMRRGSIDQSFVADHGFGDVGDYIVISVIDTGSGMEESTVAKIFDPFFTTKDVGKGTGLGMSMAIGIVKQHGGIIDVQSVWGEGSCISIYLPEIVDSDIVDEPLKTNNSRMTGGSETILIAEDDAGVRDFMVKFLSLFGYNVLTAIDGQDAIDRYMAESDSIGLVIFDVIMPRKTGLVARDEIRARYPQAKFIFTSGYASEVITSKGLLADDILLMKPVNPLSLLENIRNLLDINSRDGCVVLK